MLSLPMCQFDPRRDGSRHCASPAGRQHRRSRLWRQRRRRDDWIPMTAWPLPSTIAHIPPCRKSVRRRRSDRPGRRTCGDLLWSWV